MSELFQQIAQFVQDQINDNDLFKGGLILGAGAALLAYARAWPMIIWGWIKYHTTVELDIPEGSEAFKWIDRWLAQHNYSLNRARRLTAIALKKNGESIPHIAPAPGRHYLFEGGRFLILKRSREPLETANAKGKAYSESMTITILGRTRKPALQLLKKAFALADKPKTTVTVNYCDDYGNWFRLLEKTPRPISSIVLPGDERQRIIDDTRRFLSSQEHYLKLGVPWRRGYLFYGPPGNGKSSMVFGLASELDMEISYLNLREINDTTLMRGLSDTPMNSILLIEDIDCMFETDNSRETNSQVSFATLINVLDGIASQDGQLIIMTTNHRDKLDPALIRPGRVDMEIKFENATTAQASELYQLFYPGAWRFFEQFTRAYEALPQRMSMAALQGHFLVSDAEAALDLQEFSNEPT